MKKFGTEADYEDDFEDEISKSQIKRELLALKELGKQLAELPIKDLDKLGLSERLYEAVVKAHGMAKGAYKRQLGTIGKVIVHEDSDEIKLKLDKLRQTHNGELKRFQKLEDWRDQLIADDAEVMTVLRNEFVTFDMQYVRQLVRNAKKEVSAEKEPKSSKLLFKYLQQCEPRDY